LLAPQYVQVTVRSLPSTLSAPAQPMQENITGSVAPAGSATSRPSAVLPSFTT